MSYIINKSNGSKLVTIEDGSINVTASDLSLVGKNYAGYGESIATNFVRLLENFSSPKQPAKPLTGQIWYDSSNKKIKVFNGSDFKSIPALQSGRDYPVDQLKGDLHYNEAEGKLYYFDGQGYVLIGPQLSAKAAVNTVTPALLEGVDGLFRYVLKHQIQNYYNETDIIDVAITSREPFVPLSEEYSTLFPVVKPGITLAGADSFSGVSSTSTNDGFVMWGTAADSLRLDGKFASEYVTYAQPNFTSQLTISNPDGINIGANRLRLFSNTNGAQINSSQSTIGFNATAGGELFNVVNISAGDSLALLPSVTLGTLVNIGSNSKPFNDIYGTRIFGEVQSTVAAAEVANAVVLTPTFTTNATHYIPFVDSTSGNEGLKTDAGLVYNPAANLFTATNISISQIFKMASSANGVGDIGQTGNRFGTVYANTTTAAFADLAEKYLADAEYEPGTVLRLGGAAEVTICATYESEGIAGIVSTNPAYLMNDALENGVAIALKGRVPCKVKGPVKKGDVLVSSSTPGHAEVRKYGHRTNPLAVLGKALQDFDGDTGVIEVMVY